VCVCVRVCVTVCVRVCVWASVCACAFKTSQIYNDLIILILYLPGICNTIGRFLFGFVILSPYLSALLVNNICMVITSFSVILTPFCATFPQMAAASAAYGLFSGELA